MKLTKKGSRYYLVKRVPDRFASIEPRKQVWISLRTDSKREAERRAVEALSDLENQWIAKLNGTYGSTERYHNLIEISEARGLPYLPAEQIAQKSLEEILRRVTMAQENKIVAAAVLGSELPKRYRISQILDLYLELVATDVQQKGPDQRRVWENTLRRSVARLLEVIGDKYLDELTREDALQFRQYWGNRIVNDGLSTASANRELTCISGILSKLHGSVAKFSSI